MDDVFVDLYRHNRWANERLLDACEALPPEMLRARVDGTYGPVEETILHLLSAECRYVLRLTGTELPAPVSEAGGFPGFDRLRESARASGDALISVAASIGPDETFRTTFDDRNLEIRRRVVLVQAINHATEHRAHVMTTITANGAESFEIDGWSWGAGAGYFTSLDG